MIDCAARMFLRCDGAVMPDADHPSYETWVGLVFDHDPAERPEWLFGDGFPDPPAEILMTYVTRLFMSPVSSLSHFSDAQIAMGLKYLVYLPVTDAAWCYDRTISKLTRVAFVKSIQTLFAELFAPRVNSALAACDEPGSNRPLNSLCYMWWDEFPPLALKDDPMHDPLQMLAIEVMGRTLVLESIACQEAALHGLGHWCSQYRREPELRRRIESIIDGFIARNRRRVRPELLAYALAARRGMVL